jgi:hypothetical protein
MSQHPRDNFEFRRKAQKVFVDRATGDVVLRLHATEIVRVRPNGDVVLSTGGWATHKTLSSMNDALELFAMWVEAPSRNPPDGHWQVTDSDGTTVIPYAASSNQPKTIPARSADDKQRGQWLAEAYEVPYTPPPAAAGPRIAAAAPSGPRTVAQQPAPAASASAASSAQANGIGGSWANVARQATPTYQATSGEGHRRIKGEGGGGGAGRELLAAAVRTTMHAL